MTWSLAKRTSICTHQRLRSAAHLHSLIRVFDGSFKGNQGSDVSSGGKTRIVRESDYSPLQYLACSKRPECLRILSGNIILTSIKGHNTLTNLGKMTANNPNLDLVIINSYIKFGENLSICSQDIERK